MLESDKVKVFVHLEHGSDVRSWRAQYQRGMTPDATPYGYHHAEDMGFSVDFSKDSKEGRVANVLRRGIAKILGFDLLHAWRNYAGMMTSNAIWTHTEREHLAICCLLKARQRAQRPCLIAQSVWLFDSWATLSAWKRALYRWLMREADILTTLSEHNLRVLQSAMPDARLQTLLFGISLDSFPIVTPADSEARATEKLKVAALGNDRHRDWDTLVRAVKGDTRAGLKIATRRDLSCIARDAKNITFGPAKGQKQVCELYAWSDVVVVPLKHNLHASGVTVVLEAVALGKPVIASDTGGLRSYFGDDEIAYVPPGNPNALRSAIAEVRESYEDSLGKARLAQTRLLTSELTTVGYARRHVELTLELLRRR